MQSVFYSWQRDLPNSTNRGFIQDCLEKAIKELHAEESFAVEPALDRDTQGTTGSPDIADTIFDKIDQCAAFVADISIINGSRMSKSDVEEGSINRCECTRPTPNPNVMAEWGRASHSVKFERIIAILNLATGEIEELPFDLRKRKVVTYSLRENEDKTDAKKMLVGKMKSELKGILELPSAQIDLQFGNRDTETVAGQSLIIQAVRCEIPKLESIPLYGKNDGSLAAMASLAMSTYRTNEKYYREKAIYLFYKSLLRPVSLRVANSGSKLLRNLRLEVLIKDRGILVSNAADMPQIPQKRSSLIAPIRGIQSSLLAMQTPGTVTIRKVGEHHKISIRFLDLQAKATSFSGWFFVGSIASQSVNLECLIYSDDLPAPIKPILNVEFATTDRKVEFPELKEELSEENWI